MTSVLITTPDGHLVAGEMEKTRSGVSITGHLVCGPHDDGDHHLEGSPLFHAGNNESIEGERDA